MAKALRQDITGLRAIAVLAVTLFHIDHVMLPNIDIIKGGFLGVDIFFVISGFLMTMIIMRGLDAGNFSVLKFYQRRAKRICPALIATVVGVLFLGALTLGPGDFETAAREASKALLFVSNHYFSSRVGYFDGSAVDRLFLHTWSLSVEWQFYIAYPFVLMLAKRFLSNKALALLLLGLTVVLFVFACVYTTINATNSYYLLPSRAFELIFGALAYFYPLSFFQSMSKGAGSEASGVAKLAQKISPVALEAIGIIIIVVSLFVVSDASGWPNSSAILPLFGTYLCIAAGNQKSHLRWDLLQKLGLWSFAIYLVHWPLIVYTIKFDINVWGVWLYLLVPIFAFGALMHYSIERRRDYGYKFLGLYIVIVASALGIAKTGFPWRMQHPELAVFTSTGGDLVDDFGQPQHIGKLSRPLDLILSGDSYAKHFTTDLIERELHSISVLRIACYSYEKHFSQASFASQNKEQCRARYGNLLKTAKAYPDTPILIAQNWSMYRGNLRVRADDSLVPDQTYERYAEIIFEDINDLAKSLKGHDVYILGQHRSLGTSSGSPCFFLKSLDNPVSNLLTSTIACRDLSKASAQIRINETLKAVVKQLQESRAIVDANGKGSITYIDPSPAYCDETSCSITTTEGLPMFYDDGHFTWAGSVGVNSLILDAMGIDQGRRRSGFIGKPPLVQSAVVED